MTEIRALIRRACPAFDGMQRGHWLLAGLTPEELDTIEARLKELAGTERPQQGACVHDPEGYRAWHRYRCFIDARVMRAERGES